MKAYYNEFDPGAAAWLRQLIADGLITPGDVDDRSITDVQPADLVGYDRVHFFAGIGGWDLALTLAGWGDRPVWTGSCPCQPFSAAGKRKGFADERHLWPELFRLVRECRPHVVFGEQVASALGWLDAVCADLEGEGYACGSAIVGAHSVGAPHIRQRLYWVADAGRERREPDGLDMGTAPRGGEGEAREWERVRNDGGAGRPTDRLADADGGEPGDRGLQPGRQHGLEPQDGGAGGLADALRAGRAEGRAGAGERPAAGGGESGGGEDAGDAGQPGQAGFWGALEWLPCRDGKWRPTQPGLFPLAHGIPGRVGLLRGAGNAIVPEVAAAFIEAYQDTLRP